MRHLKLFILSILFTTLLIGISKADVGCALNYNNASSEVIYFTPIGTIGGATNYGGPVTYNNIGFPTACPRYTYSTALATSGTCCVLGNCSGTTRTLVNFTPIPCPIDDYTPMAMLLVGSAGMFFVRRRAFKFNIVS